MNKKQFDRAQGLISEINLIKSNIDLINNNWCTDELLLRNKDKLINLTSSNFIIRKVLEETLKDYKTKLDKLEQKFKTL